MGGSALATVSAIAGVDHDVFDERMDQAVPQHVGEPDEAVTVSC